MAILSWAATLLARDTNDIFPQGECVAYVHLLHTENN